MHWDSCDPFFSAEPGALAFGVLAGGEVDEFLAAFAGDFSTEVGLDVADADGFFAGFGEVFVGGDFLDGSVVYHELGAGCDALAKFFAVPV